PSPWRFEASGGVPGACPGQWRRGQTRGDAKGPVREGRTMGEIERADLRSAGWRRVILEPLARQFPDRGAALAEVARLSAELTLPKGTVHVLSDVHGDDVKLRHVINNASGTLRPLVDRLFAGRLAPAELQEFLNLIFYPRETLAMLAPALQGTGARLAFCRRNLRDLFEV